MQTPAPILDRKAEVIGRIIKAHVTRPIRRTLVVGCGSGIEAAVLASVLGSEVVGIDIKEDFDPRAEQVVSLRRGDATLLEFADDSFDLVYSYHALEHIPAYEKALAEMRRVLREPGNYCIGTPNRSRVIGYIGSEQATSAQKLKWNLIDWRARVSGKFRNEYGAHAGFTRVELANLLEVAFGNVRDITLEYYLRLYSRHQRWLSVAERIGISCLLFPSVYFVGSRGH